jgi:hypothetical protein
MFIIQELTVRRGCINRYVESFPNKKQKVKRESLVIINSNKSITFFDHISILSTSRDSISSFQGIIRVN